MRKHLFRWLFPDVFVFIQEIYLMPKDPSYFIKLPDMPAPIKELFEP